MDKYLAKEKKTWEVWNLCCHQGRRRPSRGLRSRRESTKQSNFGQTQIFKYSSLLVSSNVWSFLDLTLLSSLTNDGIFPRGGSAKAAEKRKKMIYFSYKLHKSWPSKILNDIIIHFITFAYNTYHSNQKNHTSWCLTNEDAARKTKKRCDVFPRYHFSAIRNIHVLFSTAMKQTFFIAS